MVVVIAIAVVLWFCSRLIQATGACRKKALHKIVPIHEPTATRSKRQNPRAGSQAMEPFVVALLNQPVHLSACYGTCFLRKYTSLFTPEILLHPSLANSAGPKNRAPILTIGHVVRLCSSAPGTYKS